MKISLSNIADNMMRYAAVHEVRSNTARRIGRAKKAAVTSPKSNIEADTL